MHTPLQLRSDDEIIGPMQPTAPPSLVPELPAPMPQAPVPDAIIEALANPSDAPLAVPANLTPNDVAACTTAAKGELKGKGKGVLFSEYDAGEDANLADTQETPVLDPVILHR